MILKEKLKNLPSHLEKHLPEVPEVTIKEEDLWYQEVGISQTNAYGVTEGRI